MPSSKPKTIKIQIDPELKDLIPGYLQNRKKDAASLKNGLEKADFTAIESIAHKIKGSAGGYGFTQLGEIGGEMEKAAQEKNIEALKSLCADMNEYLEAVDISFSK